MLIISAVFAGILFATLILLFVDWMFDADGAKIKFKNFKEFYEVNPERWEIYDGHVACKRVKRSLYVDHFHFSFIDWIKYKIWRRGIERREKKQSDSKATARMLESVKADIQAAKEAEAKQKQEAMEKWLRSFDHEVVDNIILKLKELEVNDKV